MKNFFQALIFFCGLLGIQTSSAALFCADIYLKKTTVALPHRHQIRMQEKRYHYYVGKELAAIITFNYRNQTLEIKYLEVQEGFQSQGISKRIFDTLVARHPHTQYIITNLIQDNARAYTRARKELGLAPQEAIKHTPAFKVKARNGFSRIVSLRELESNDGALYAELKLTRDQ